MRDLSCGDTRVYLEFEVRRILCRCCGKVKRERLDFLADNPFYTRRFAWHVGRRCRTSTIKDVAEQANVSTATVGRVLNGRGYVSEEARERVETAISQLGYRKNVLAMGLRKQHTQTIGHLLTSIALNPFFSGVSLGVERQAMEYGYSVLIYNVQGDATQEQRGVETFIERRVDGILFTTPIREENVRLALDAGIPVVQVERPTRVQTARVLVDNYSGAYQAMEHLLQLGHRKIAYVGGHPRRRTGREHAVEAQRLAGYQDALMAHNISLDEGLVVLTDYFSLDEFDHMHEGYLAVNTLLKGQPGLSALFVGSDLLVSGVMQGLYECGQRVPEDISVVSFDDTYSPYLSPPITAVQQPMMEIGRAAAALLLTELGDMEGNQEHETVLKPTLVLRKSTAVPSKTSI